MNDDDREFEHSPLSGTVTRDGEEVDVEIYRSAGTQDPWELAVIHMSSGSTKWQERFATDKEAYAAFWAVVEERGLASFGTTAGGTKH